MKFPEDPWVSRRPRAGRGGRRGRGHGRHTHSGGPGPRHRGGRARRGQVRLAALLLIAEEPRNGYQIIQELEHRTDGRWKPSPGAVYPALGQLADEGLIRLVADQKSYEITDDGRSAAAEAGEEREPWDIEPAADDVATGLETAYRQVGTALDAIAGSGDDEVIANATAQLEDLKRSLFQLLADS